MTFSVPQAGWRRRWLRMIKGKEFDAEDHADAFDEGLGDHNQGGQG